MSASTTSSQCLPPTTYGVTNSVVTSSDGHWNKVDSTDILQNTTPLEWGELPSHSIATASVTSNNVSSEYHVTSSVNNVNVLSNQLVYNPPTYMNVPYQRSAVPNGYTTLNPARGINAQHLNGPHLLRTQNGSVIGGSPWPNQTDLGRFISQAPGWRSNKTAGGVKKQKRIRTAFTSQQMMELEQEYARTRYLDRTRRIELAEILRLNERTIKIWFQNRRMKEKKDRAESLEDSEEASTSESSPEMGNIQMPMLIHEQYSGIRNEVYNQGNIYMEQYPAMSTPVSIPVTSTSMAQDHGLVQNMYQTYMSEEERQMQYQQVHLEVQPHSTPYTEVQESPETVPKTEPPTPSAPSDIIEKSWDLSWIKTMEYEDDY